MTKQKQVLVVGGGFGGLQAAMGLSRSFGRDAQVTLFEPRPYHLFTSNLYEVATAPEEMTTTDGLRHSIAVPFEQILKNYPVTRVASSVSSIRPEDRTLVAGGTSYAYDHLVIATGSQSDYFGIPGAEGYSYPLKTLEHALRIRNQIAFAFEQHRQDIVKQPLRIVVAGGGYTGVELAAELPGLVDHMCWKTGFPRAKVEIEVLEGMNQLCPGFDDRLSRDLFTRLTNIGVRVRLLAVISEVTEHHVQLSSGDKLSYDVLIWSAGVKASTIPLPESVVRDRKGRVTTERFLRVAGLQHVYAIGDCASIVDKYGKPVPGSAQDAWHQARYLASALPLLDKNQEPAGYEPDKHGFIVSCGRRWAAMSYKGWYVTGLTAYIIDLFAHFRYFNSILGPLAAARLVLFQDSIYSKNN